MARTDSTLSVVNGYHLRASKKHPDLCSHPASVPSGHRLDLELGHVRRTVVVDPHAPIPLSVVLIPRHLPVDLNVAVVGVHDLFAATDRVRTVKVRALPSKPVASVGLRSVDAHVRKPAS